MNRNIITFLLLQASIICFWLIGWWLIEIKIPFENVGAFGDQFGVLTSIFSAMAFGGVIYSMIIQTKEFKESIDSQTKSEKALVSQLKMQQKVAVISGLTLLLEQYEKHEYLKVVNFGSTAEYALERAKYINQLNEILIELQGNNN